MNSTLRVLIGLIMLAGVCLSLAVRSAPVIVEQNISSETALPPCVETVFETRTITPFFKTKIPVTKVQPNVATLSATVFADATVSSNRPSAQQIEAAQQSIGICVQEFYKTADLARVSRNPALAEPDATAFVGACVRRQPSSSQIKVDSVKLWTSTRCKR